MPLTVTSYANGKQGPTECIPTYYHCPGCVSAMVCGSALDKTADAALDLVAAPGPVQAMAR